MGDRTVDLDQEQQRLTALADPSQRLVRAGVLALLRSGRAVLDNGLSPELIAQTAERSRRSYYDHFRGKSDFTERIIDELLGFDPSPARLDVAENLIDTNTGDLAETIRIMASPPAIGNLERVDRLGRQIVTALGANDPFTRPRIEAFYARDRQVYNPLVGQLFQSWGLVFREPWTLDSASILFRVLVDGMAMRAAVDDTIDETELLLLSLSTLVPVISRLDESNDEDSVDDLIRSLSDQARYHLQERKDPALVADARKAIHEAALNEIAARGFTKTTLFHIADSAELSVRTVRHTVGELDEIVCDIFDGYIGGLDSAAELDLEQSCADDPWRATVKHMHRTATLMAERPVLIQTVAGLAVTGDSDAALRSIARLDEILVRLLQHAQQARQFNRESTVEELDLAAHAGLRLVVRSTSADPEQCATDALFVVARCCGVES